MRVLHILDHSLPLHSGYAFRTAAILHQQRAMGWETVQLTTPRHRRDGPDPEVVDGLAFHRTPPPRGAGPRSMVPGMREGLEMRATARRLEALCRREQPDILHAHSPVLNAMPALRVGRKLGLPVVYEVRAFWEDAAVSAGQCREGDLRYRLSQRLETRALQRADAITTICDGLRGDMVARGIPAVKIAVVPNAVDIDKFDRSPDPDPDLVAKHRLAGRPVIGFIGSFYHYEGLDLLLAAVARLPADRAAPALLLVGGGPEEAALRRTAELMPSSAFVTFAGRVSQEEITRYYSVVDVLVYPRRSLRITELVTPLKPLEAMAMGKIVLASNVGGHRELIAHDSTGFLFPPNDPDALAQAVRSTFERQPQWPEIAQRARRFVETNRTWQRSVASYAPVYARLEQASSGTHAPLR